MSTTPEGFRFEAGNLGLDFLNTMRLGHLGAVDGLRTGQDVEDWLTSAAGTPTEGPAVPPRAAPDARLLLTEAQRLREDLETLVRSFKAERPLPEAALHTLNRILAARQTLAQVEWVEGRLVLTMREAGDSRLAPLVPVALAAVDLLTRADPTRVRRCASRACRLWFLDSSKNGRRKWCSMARCGNRAKVARHHRRRRLEGGR